MTSGLSQLIVVLLLLFLLVGSGVLIWDGLSTGFGHGPGRGAVIHDHEHVKARLVVGIFGFGLAAWVVLGLLSHAH